MAEEKHILSKSTYLRALQCHKSLYLYKNYIYLRDKLTGEQRFKFSRGHNVGKVAQRLFPGGVDASGMLKAAEAAENTASLISEGKKVLYEAAFRYNRVFAATDILVKEDDEWAAYEVKSAARVTQNNLQDASLQYYVLKGNGLPVKDFFMVLLDQSYIKQGALEPEKLFKKVSVLEQVIKNQPVIEESIRLALEMLEKNEMPDVPVGAHCFEPYTCDFKGQCWQESSKSPVFSLGNMPRRDQFEMFEKGFKTIADVPADFPLTQEQRIQVEAIKSGRPLIKLNELSRFIKSISYPLHFMDFESMMPAIPLFNGTSPFQNLPFQYSVHYIKDLNAKPLHFHFLAEAGADPRKAFIENLLKHIGPEGDILVYNADAERKTLNALKNDFPVFKDKIEAIIARVKDLALPFLKYWYYHPAMKGSTSVKNVLPALAPGLDYSGLEINSGNAASIAFESLQHESDMFKIEETREQLLSYCKMDTYALVVIWKKLNEELKRMTDDECLMTDV